MESLSEFIKKVRLINKDIAEYYDEDKGNKSIVPTSYLFARVDLLELTNDEIKRERFGGNIDKKKLDYNYVETTRPMSKYETTKREEDKYTIIDGKIKVNQIWRVSNGLKYIECFNNKEEALELADKINKELIDNM